MSLFDRVWVDCPNCHRRVEFQSKAGPCCLRDYTLENAPLEVLADVLRDLQVCEGCGTRVSLTLITQPQVEVVG